MIKKMCFLLIAVLMSSAMFAQQTSMAVDCQNPGWLSYIIKYGDQLTVKNLTVSGYINSTDLKFLGNMISNRSLKHLDLSMANIVYDDPRQNNTLETSAFKTTGHIDFLSLPISLKKTTHCFGYSASSDSPQYLLKVDTLEVGGEAMNVIEKKAFSYTDGRNSNIYIKNLILREGVDSIADGAFGYFQSYGYTGETPQLKSISFPSTMKYIGKKAFYKCDSLSLSSIILPESIEEIQTAAFYSEYLEPLDTIVLPKNLRHYTTSAFCAKSGQVIYMSEDVETIENLDNIEQCYFNIWSKVELHVKAINPPKITYSSKSLENCIIYVPVGCKKSYENADYWKKATIIEEIYVDGVSLECTNRMYVGQTQLAKTSITPTDALNQKVVWNSSNSNVLTISSEGKITAIAPGEATVKVITKDGGYCDSVKVSVYEHTTGIELQEQLNIKVGEHIRLSATTLPLGTSDGLINWESNDEYIATVDSKGFVYGVKQGTCIIKATSVDGGYTAECVVTVMKPVEQVQLTEHNISLNVGETKKLGTTILPANADNKSLVWSSSNNEVVAVNENGEIEALKFGNAYIKVTSVDNPLAMDSCLITVTQPATGITLNYVNYTLDAIGESIQLTATVSPENATNKDVKWTSSNESVCVVNNGLVVGVGEGTAVIVATTVDGGHMATCVITVKNKEYLLTYVVDGKVYHTESLPQGEKITLPEEPAKEGYTFSGWIDIPETMPEENITISGTFTINQYNVTYIIDGEVYTTIAVTYGENITLPEVPEKEGCTFAWTDKIPETMPAEDIVINGSYISTDNVSNIVLYDEVLNIYTVDGQRVSRLCQGLNIILMKDGSIRKVLVK